MYRDYDEERDNELYHYAVKTALEAGAATDNPKTAAAVLVGSSAGSRAIQSRRRKKNLESVRNNFGNVEGAYD